MKHWDLITFLFRFCLHNPLSKSFFILLFRQNRWNTTKEIDTLKFRMNIKLCIPTKNLSEDFGTLHSTILDFFSVFTSFLHPSITSERNWQTSHGKEQRQQCLHANVLPLCIVIVPSIIKSKVNRDTGWFSSNHQLVWRKI